MNKGVCQQHIGLCIQIVLILGYQQHNHRQGYAIEIGGLNEMLR